MHDRATSVASSFHYAQQDTESTRHVYITGMKLGNHHTHWFLPI